MNVMKKMTIEFDLQYKVDIVPDRGLFDIQWYKDGKKMENFVMRREELLGYLGKEFELVGNQSRT